MAELDKISRVQSLFSPHFLLIILIYLVRALATLCKLGGPSGCKGLVQRTGKYCCIRHMEYKPEYLSNGLPSTQLAGATYTSRTAKAEKKKSIHKVWNLLVLVYVNTDRKYVGIKIG